jgi:hypothetical protein
VGRVSTLNLDPKNPESMAKAIKDLATAVDGGIEFGDHNRPLDPTSTDRAGDSSVSEQHNGSLINIQGSYVTVQVDTLTNGAQDITCNHNLYLDNPEYTLISGTVNVNWQVHRFTHNGTGLIPPIGLSVMYNETKTIAVNSIELTFGVLFGAGSIDDILTNPLSVTLFFTKAVR